MTQLSSNKVAQHLDISVATLNNWYKWYNNLEFKKPENTPELPSYTQQGKRGTRYWDKKDLPKLVQFKKWMPRGRAGVMGDSNAQFWGERGKRALRNKHLQND